MMLKEQITKYGVPDIETRIIEEIKITKNHQAIKQCKK